MGYPVTPDLTEILKENFTPREAEVALAIPTSVIPLETASVDEILKGSRLSHKDLTETLEGLVEKGMLFTGTDEEGERGYALLQVGFGFPQTFFWKGEETPHGRKMAGMVAKYFNRKVTAEAYGTETKPYRYIPVAQSLKPELQAVYSRNMMDRVVDEAELIAVAHCPCRTAYKWAGRGCDHPVEVCLKFDDMARYVIDRGLAREVNKDEAKEILRTAEEAGLVHFVDNCEGEIKHNCNCCGCACWNVGNIRRRKIPRDMLMAVYFTRRTDEDECSGCGECEEICPVDAVEMKDDLPAVDTEWCIGCGVCATVCPSDAITMEPRPDRTDAPPAKHFNELHEQILREKG
jgi:Pyruvate/2-oxoacid:ferredoxin oxidoreductase delta subunit